jgi:hypothetical protein
MGQLSTKRTQPSSFPYPLPAIQTQQDIILLEPPRPIMPNAGKDCSRVLLPVTCGNQLALAVERSHPSCEFGCPNAITTTLPLYQVLATVPPSFSPPSPTAQRGWRPTGSAARFRREVCKTFPSAAMCWLKSSRTAGGADSPVVSSLSEGDDSRGSLTTGCVGSGV